MEIKNIKNLTKEGSYKVNVHLNDLLEVLKQYEKEGLQYNSNIQYDYTWPKQQQISFIESLIKNNDENNKINRDIHLIYLNQNRNFIIADGQQRLIACKRFLNNKIPVFGRYLNDFKDEMTDSMYLIFNINNLKTM